jgi:uncharacterized protein (TIRG00374 family)
LAIVAYLIYDVQRHDNFAQLWSGSKDWMLLAVALVLFLSAHLLTIARWYWLVRALDLPFRWNDAVRLGFLGYLLTFVSPGAVGGDLLKAFFVAREQPGRRIEAFATVIVDRIFGLYALLLLAAGAILVSGLWRDPASAPTRILCQVALLVTALATAGILGVFALGGHGGRRYLERLAVLPRLGSFLRPLTAAVQVYRSNVGTVGTSIAVGLVVQSLLAGCVWATASALLPQAPTLGQHLVIVPLALLTTMLPLPGYGLGAFEFSVEFLYRNVAAADAGSGLLVALGFRLVMIATAVISAVVYASNRREVAEVLREAEAETERLTAPV